MSALCYLCRLAGSRIAYMAVAVWLNTAKDHKRPTKDRKGALRAKLQEIGTNWTQWCLIFQCAPRFFTCCRTYWEPDWKALSKPQRQRVRHSVFSLACEDDAAWHAAINIYWWQPDRPAPSRIQMLGRNWEVVVDQVPTAQNKKQKLINFCRGLKMVVS